MKTAKFIFIVFIAFNAMIIKEVTGQEPVIGLQKAPLTGGNVGIGTTNPIEKLHLEGGNFLMRSTNPFILLNNTNSNGTTGITFQYNGNWKGWIYYNELGDHLMINAQEGDGYRPDLVIKSNGFVGIGTLIPSGKLHVAAAAYEFTGIFGTNVAPWSAGTNVAVGNTGEDAALYVGQGGDRTGYLWWDYNSNPANASFRIGTFNGANPLFLQPNGGGIRVGNDYAVPTSEFEVCLDANHFVRLGYTSAQSNYYYHAESSSDGDGQAGLYAYRTHIDVNDGSAYSLTTSNSSIIGYNYWGDMYSFGTSGFNYNDLTRCGGVLGANWNGTYWGTLGYEDSGGSYYGGYFNSYGTGTGGGKGPATPQMGVGIGAWGNLMGADIHGNIYGSYIEGNNYALFTNGTVYKNDMDVHLQNDGNGGNIILYTIVTTEVTVQTCGVASLSSGRAGVSFDPAFQAAVSLKEPVVVTVTPTGPCNGVYLSKVNGNGFEMVEMNEGRSNVTVNYIAIGKRAGYEEPELSPELIDGTYVEKMSRGLHNDADTQTNGEGLYYENGQLTVGIHPSTLPDPAKPLDGPEMQKKTGSGSQVDDDKGKTAGWNGEEKDE
jgi:hypothetical protein